MIIFAIYKPNPKITDILSQSIGKIPYYSYCGISLYKCRYGDFILKDEGIPSLMYNISTIITNDNSRPNQLQCIMIPTNTDTSKTQYNIINNIDENDEFMTNAQLLIKNNPCVMIIVTLNSGNILYLQTKNQDDEWQYTIIDFKKKTITSIPYQIINKTSIYPGMSISEIIGILGQPLYIMNSASNPDVIQYIYSFGYPHVKTEDNKNALRNKEEPEATELHNIYSSYIIIVTTNQEQVMNVEYNYNVKS